MNRLPTFKLAALCALAVSAKLIAADPPAGSAFGLAPSAPEPLQPTTPAQTPATPAQTPTGVPLIPDAVQPADKGATVGGTPAPAAGQKDKQNQTVVEDDKLKNRIKYRKAMTIALRDPGLQALKQTALHSKTDFEFRHHFIDYYNGLFDLVEKIDKTLDHDATEVMRKACTARYFEARIEPSIDPATFRKKNP